MNQRFLNFIYTASRHSEVTVPKALYIGRRRTYGVYAMTVEIKWHIFIQFKGMVLPIELNYKKETTLIRTQLYRLIVVLIALIFCQLKLRPSQFCIWWSLRTLFVSTYCLHLYGLRLDHSLAHHLSL